MTHGISMLVLVLASLAGAIAWGQELAGIPVFSDDFRVQGLFAEHWEASKGTRCEEGRAIIPAANQMTLRRIAEGDFAFAAEVAVAKPANPDSGHCGVILDGIHFMITPSTVRPTAIANTAYRVPGESRLRGRSGGDILGFEFGKPITITISRVKVGEACKYSYAVDGRPVDSFIAMLPAQGKIAFYGSRYGISVSDFRLYAVRSVDSRNLVINSSFEHLQEGMPNFMKPLMGRKARFEGRWEDFLNAFTIDTQEKVSGKNSAKMVLGDGFPHAALPSPWFSNGVGTHDVSVAAHTPVTFSIYLKASEDDFPVTMNIWEQWHKNHSKVIKVSRQWQRYFFTLEKPERGVVRGNVTFRNAGTLWADDLQMEIGGEATPYRASALDQDKFAEAKPAPATEKAPSPAPAGAPRKSEAYTRYNYYMNEGTAVLVGTLDVPGADTLTGRIGLAGKTWDVALERQFAVDLPLHGVADGEHPIRLDVYRGTQHLTAATATLVKRPFKPGATQIDRERRCLVVDGKPCLVIAPFFTMEHGISPADQDRILKNLLRLHKAMGYRCFHVASKDDPPFPQQTRAFYELCAQEGITIIHWPFNAYATRNDPAQRFRTQPGVNIIAWQVIDEPEIGPLAAADVEAFLASHQAASPYTPVFMNNTLIGIPRRYANLRTDILMLDDYLTNRENRRVAEMIDATDMMMEAGREDRKPVFYFLAGENLQNHHRECTYAEQVAQTYGVILAGARGVSYFCSLPLYPENYRACVDVNRELLDLEQVILSLQKTSAAAVSDPSIRFITRRLDDKLYILTLNASNDRAADAVITLPPEFNYAGGADVKFENRNVEVVNGKISDRYKPLERHVYVARLAK